MQNILRMKAQKRNNKRSRPKTELIKTAWWEVPGLVFNKRQVQHAMKELLVWQITVVQHNQTYEIMHLASVFFIK